MVLATKDYKVKMGLAPHTHEYNLWSTNEFKLENVKTAHYGTESLSFLGLKIGNLCH